jgi:hypothetical protein
MITLPSMDAISPVSLRIAQWLSEANGGSDLARSLYEGTLRIIEQVTREGWKQFDSSNKEISELPVEIN